MLFNSYIFIFVFLPVCLLFYFTLHHFKQQKFAKLSLLIFSLYFYAYFEINYLFIMVASIIINYGLSCVLLSATFNNREKYRKFIFTFGLVINIGVLFYFKYFNFFLNSLSSILMFKFSAREILLPLGLSFFTFQQLSYVIDSYKQKVPKYNVLDYSLFVSFFPQLIAGPIVLHNEIIPQFEKKENWRFNYENFSLGLFAFSRGIAKKVLIADTFGGVSDWGFANAFSLDTTNLIVTVLCYTIQIYFDFSGYCDMATGLAKMFNINLPINFDSPYKSLTINEFWKRWHMTLTRFLKTYIYFPLGGNRKGMVRTYFNLLVTFLISGLWHGANITFIIWGLLHGIAIMLNKAFSSKINKIHPAALWILTFSFVAVTWVYFRANTLAEANMIIGKILAFNFQPIHSQLISSFEMPIIGSLLDLGANISTIFYSIKIRLFPIMLIIILLSLLIFDNTNEKMLRFKPTFLQSLSTTALLFFSIISLSGVAAFLYFNF